MKILILCVFVCSSLCLCAQSESDCELTTRSPISYQTRLSGSYGEPRSRHFHAGIDYKQRRGVPHDTIYSIAEGYVSRISVQPDGYGNALYIDHPCDKTSVYAHLHQFAPDIQSYIDSIMYARRSYTANIYPREIGDTLSLTEGQYIGIMGNTGRSSGPHLHFEIRDTPSETPVNPALLGFKPSDDIPPHIGGIYIYEFTPDNEEISRKYYKATKSSSGFYEIDPQIITTGAHKIGFGIRTYDQMNGASNHNGIYSLDMYADGKAKFGFTLDKIPFDHAKYIHTHMDYREKKENRYVTNCFVTDINQLDIYRSDDSKGFVQPYSYRSTDINIVVSDIEKNKSVLRLSIRRDDSRLYDLGFIDTSKQRLTPLEDQYLSNTGSHVSFYDSTFCQPTRISMGSYNPVQIDLRQEVEIATFRMFRLDHTYKPEELPKDKYVITSINDKGEILRHKTRWSDDSTMVSYLSELKMYQVEVDTISPKIKIIHLPNTSRKTCKAQITDNMLPQHHTDDLNIEVYLDEEWILCQLDGKSNTIKFEMPVDRSQIEHVVKWVVKDASGNTSSISRSFIY